MAPARSKPSSRLCDCPPHFEKRKIAYCKKKPLPWTRSVWPPGQQEKRYSCLMGSYSARLERHARKAGRVVVRGPKFEVFRILDLEHRTSCRAFPASPASRARVDRGKNHMLLSSTLVAGAPVAQLDRASASGAEGHRFKSCQAHQQTSKGLQPHTDFRHRYPVGR